MKGDIPPNRAGRRHLPVLCIWLSAVAFFASATSFAAAAAGPAGMRADPGFEWSIASNTQGNFGALGIGVGYVGGGDYLDIGGVRRSGLHAGITITVQGRPALFRQPDVHEGQMLTVGAYRILIERILPGRQGRGTIVLRIWFPPAGERHDP